MKENKTQKENQMTSEKNKELVRHIYEEVSKGNHQAFIDAVTDNFTFTLIGTTPFSGTYRGVQELFEKSIGPVMSALETQPRLVVDRIIAEGDYVVVVDHGEGGITKEGKDYNNTYCNVIRLQDGKIAEVTEYCDTALVNAVLRRE
jgi:ketosteroid isomerase-like protein